MRTIHLLQPEALRQLEEAFVSIDFREMARIEPITHVPLGTRVPPGTKLFHIGISGGKDSTALLLWAVHESGIPHDQIEVTFSDTGNEHEWTYWYIRWLSKNVFPITWLKPDLDFYELAKKKKRFPSQVARFCTQHLKMIPAERHIRQRVEEGYEVIAMSGIRNDESYERADRKEFEPACGSAFGVRVWNPLVRKTINDVWALHARYGVPRNPLYVATQTARGSSVEDGVRWIETVLFKRRPFRDPASRVGCYPCINSRKREIANIARNFPDRISMIREAEATMTSSYQFNGFFHRKGVPKRFHSKIIELLPLKSADQRGSSDSLFPGETITGLTTQGLEVTVPTIDDVVRWATETIDCSLELDFETAEERAAFLEREQMAARLCSSRYGACE